MTEKELYDMTLEPGTVIIENIGNGFYKILRVNDTNIRRKHSKGDRVIVLKSVENYPQINVKQLNGDHKTYIVTKIDVILSTLK